MTRARWILCGTALLVLAAGCGQDESPADAVPALSSQLDSVDAAIDSGRFGAARSALADLGDETEKARADGTLDEDDAEAILAAISAVEGQLPEPTGQPSATPPATPETPVAEPGDEEKAEPQPKPPKKPHGKKPKKPHKKPGHGHGR